MPAAAKKCQLDGCDRAASTNCFCCQKNVCTKHFMKHIDAVKAQIDPLANETNEMVENIQDLTVEKITEISFGELQQWKCDMHQLIDEIFLAKTKEMEDLIATSKEKFVEHKKQQLETMMKIQDQVKQLVEDDDVTFEQIQSLKNQLTTVQTDLTSFGKDFLLLNVRVYAEGLVAVSSKLNTPAPTPSPVRQKFRPKYRATVNFPSTENSKSAQPGFTFGATPLQPSTASAFQNNPTRNASAPIVSMFGGVSTNATSTSYATPSSTSAASANIASPFGNPSIFSFPNNGRK